MKNTNTQDAIAAFLAKGGAITKANEGEGLGLTNRQWYRQARDIAPVKVITEDEAAQIEDAMYEREHEIGAAYGVDGVNDFRAGVRKHGAKAMLGWK